MESRTASSEVSSVRLSVMNPRKFLSIGTRSTELPVIYKGTVWVKKPPARQGGAVRLRWRQSGSVGARAPGSLAFPAKSFGAPLAATAATSVASPLARRPGTSGPSSLLVVAAGKKGYKMKTHKALAKRFRVTGRGKIVRRCAGKQHLLRKNTKRRKRLSKMQRHEVQPNFRRLLCSKLQRLIESKKVEKVDKYYRLLDSFATRTPAPLKASNPKQKDPSKASKNPGMFDVVSPALEATAYKVANAEVKAHLAHEHMIQAERILKIAEETESLLTLAEEIFERCSRGEIITINQVSQREY